MAHELEIREDGTVSMAYVGECPWHRLGTKVPPGLGTLEFMKLAGLDWEVVKEPAYSVINGNVIPVGWSSLYRKTDFKVLDTVSDEWFELQNKQQFEFISDFVANGDMSIETGGSLAGGQIVWVLAKINESFDLFKGDTIDSYLLFTNYHKYGFSTDIRFTPIRVVCKNTLSISLNSMNVQFAKFSHRKAFNPEIAKETLGIVTTKMEKYKEMATFLGSKKTKEEDIVQFFKRLYPTASIKEPMSRNAKKGLDVLNLQPGAEFAQGTWWTPFNAVTYMTDHLLSRTDDTRLVSAWYGDGKNKKNRALELAVEYAQSA